jgi:hypothetical protein
MGYKMLYFKFKDNLHSWVLPVYEESTMAKEPENCFGWDNTIKFSGQVTKAEYDAQFEHAQASFNFEFD